MSTPPMSARARWILFLGLVLLAVNLRPATVDVTPVLTEAAEALGLGINGASALTSIPVICFGVFAAAGPAVIRRLGVHRTALVVAAVATVGLIGRLWAEDAWLFIAWTIVVMAALGIGNVLLPALVKQDFWDRLGLATASYTAAVAVGIAGGSMASAPLAAVFGWRAALVPALVVAALATLVWTAIVSTRLAPAPSTGLPSDTSMSVRDVARTKIGWLLVILFTCQSGLAFSVFGWLPSLFRAAGLDPVTSGSLLGYLNLFGLALAFPIPAYLSRHPRANWVVPVIGIGGLVGLAGLIVAPTLAPFGWATLIAIGLAGFPVFLTLLSLRARTPSGTAALSAFAQAGGFLLAAPMPFMSGVMVNLTGSWTAPVILWMVLLAGMTIAGQAALRAGFVEDEPARAAH